MSQEKRRIRSQWQGASEQSAGLEQITQKISSSWSNSDVNKTGAIERFISKMTAADNNENPRDVLEINYRLIGALSLSYTTNTFDSADEYLLQ